MIFRLFKNLKNPGTTLHMSVRLWRNRMPRLVLKITDAYSPLTHEKQSAFSLARIYTGQKSQYSRRPYKATPGCFSNASFTTILTDE